MRYLLLALCLLVSITYGCAEKYEGSKEWTRAVVFCEAGKILAHNDCVNAYRYTPNQENSWSCKPVEFKPEGMPCQPNAPGFQNRGYCNSLGECVAPKISCDDGNPCTGDSYYVMDVHPSFNEWYGMTMYAHKESRCRHSNQPDNEHCLYGGKCWAGKCIWEKPDGTVMILHPKVMQPDHGSGSIP